MTYRVVTDAAPAYELIMSLDAFLVAPSHRTIDLGENWAQQTRASLAPAFAAELAALVEPPDFRLLGPLVRQCPGARDGLGFVQWLARLSAGELYERVAGLGLALPADLTAFRDQTAALLGAWHEQYFGHVEPALLAGLAADAERVRGLDLGPALLVEEATRGYWLEPAPDLHEVVLVPQYHKRPVTLYGRFKGQALFFYPCADLPGKAGEPGADLLRLVRALADESRLRLLYDLAGAPRSFMELVASSGLTKGTVHRHLWLLRFAGLVRAHMSDGRFSLRPGAFERVSSALSSFTMGKLLQCAGGFAAVGEASGDGSGERSI